MGQEGQTQNTQENTEKARIRTREPASGGRKVCHNLDAIEYLLTRQITLSTTCQQGCEGVGGLTVGSETGKGKK